MKKLYIIIITALISMCAIARPTISNFSPTTGPVGTTVTINGNNFNSTTSK